MNSMLGSNTENDTEVTHHTRPFCRRVAHNLNPLSLKMSSNGNGQDEPSRTVTGVNGFIFPPIIFGSSSFVSSLPWHGVVDSTCHTLLAVDMILELSQIEGSLKS